MKSNSIQIAQLKETIKNLEEAGIEVVTIEVKDSNKVLFQSADSSSLSCYCFSKEITDRWKLEKV